jgi:uncharacterized protein YggE
MRSVRLAAVLGALALGALAVGLLAFPAGAQEAAGAEEERTITVNGNASVSAVPDRAEWSFGVQTQGETAAAALKANAATMEKVIAALRGAGIPAADLRTEQVSLFPQTDENGKVTAFTATNSVHAVVRSLGSAGTIVDAATEAGANQIFGPTLTLSDSEEIYGQALEQAYDQARGKAERLAAKAGVTLGLVVNVTEGGDSVVPVAAAADRAAGEGSVPIEPGTTEIQGFVTVTFSIA